MPKHHLCPSDLLLFKQAISSILSRWSILQLAVEKQWGGNNSFSKAKLLAADILNLFTTKEHFGMRILKHTLRKAIFWSFRAVADDGSIDEVATLLVTTHQECLSSRYVPTEQLGKPIPPTATLSNGPINYFPTEELGLAATPSSGETNHVPTNDRRASFSRFEILSFEDIYRGDTLDADEKSLDQAIKEWRSQEIGRNLWGMPCRSCHLLCKVGSTEVETH